MGQTQAPEQQLKTTDLNVQSHSRMAGFKAEEFSLPSKASAIVEAPEYQTEESGLGRGQTQGTP